MPIQFTQLPLALAALAVLGQVKAMVMLEAAELIQFLAVLLQQQAVVVVLVHQHKKMVWQAGQVVALDLQVDQVELLGREILHPPHHHKAVVAAQVRTVHIEAAVEAAAHQQQAQTHQALAALLVVMALHQAFLEHPLHTLAAAVAVLIPVPILLAVQVEQAAAEQVGIPVLALLALQTRVAAAAARN
jgi:hypothetical protein